MGFNQTENNFQQNYFNNQLQFILNQELPELWATLQEINQRQLDTYEKVREYYRDQNIELINKKEGLEKEVSKRIEEGKELRIVGKNLREEGERLRIESEHLQKDHQSLTEEGNELRITSENLQKDCQNLREEGKRLRIEREHLQKDCENRCDEIMAKYTIPFSEELKRQNQIKLDALTKRVDLIISKGDTYPRRFIINICCFVSDIFTGLANRTSSCYDLGKNLMQRSYQNNHLKSLAVVIFGVMGCIFSRKTNHDMLLCDISNRKVTSTRVGSFIVGRPNE